MIHAPTLLLSAGFEPLAVISWQKAITLLWLQKGDVLVHHANSVVRSPTVSMHLPAVMKLYRFFRKKPVAIPFNHRNLYLRDNFTCQYCLRRYSATQLTSDHVVPRSKGGKTTWNNMVAACRRCNTKKGSQLLEHSDFTLQRSPHAPTWLPGMAPLLGAQQMPAEWKAYL